MYIDKDRYKVIGWKNFVMLHWIVNPMMAPNEILGGMRIPKIILEDKLSDKPRAERTFIPCPHCNTLHDARLYGHNQGTHKGHYFGYYCPECGDVIPCHLNLTTGLLVGITAPVWWWFRKPIYQRWLAAQPARYLNFDTEPPKKYNGKWWPAAALVFGLPSALLPSIIIYNNTGSLPDTWYILLCLLMGALGGLVFGYGLHRYFSVRGEEDEDNSLYSDYLPEKEPLVNNDPEPQRNRNTG